MKAYIALGEAETRRYNNGIFPHRPKKMFREFELRRYFYSLLVAAGITVPCLAIRVPGHETDVVMLFLVGAVIAAAWFGRGPAIFYSCLAVSLFNYFFVEPYYSFNAYNSSYWLTFLVMFFASVVISTFAARLREQLIISERREKHALFLYELTKSLSQATTQSEMSETFLSSLTRELGCSGRIAPSETSGAKNTFPIKAAEHSFGVLILDAAAELPDDQHRTVETAVSLLAAAIDRITAGQHAEQSRLMAEREKVRSTLLSAVSHDLRTPLAAISGAAETLAQKSPDEPLLSSIKNESTRLNRLVTNLLDVTRMEGSGVRLNMRAYAPAEIIGSGISASSASLTRHELSLQVEDNLPFVRMDGLLISQLVQNLLENAARHTPPGSRITLSAYMRENSLCMTVADNGPGIPTGQEREIFNKFVSYAQGDAKGAGLGLAICQSIVTAHNGRIYATNKADGGARFVVELPPDLTLNTLEASDA